MNHASTESTDSETGHFARFRTRLIWLVLLLVIPAFGLVLYGNLEQRRIETIRVREGATAIAQLAAANQENFIKNSRQLLATLGDIPFLVLATNQSFCETHFSNLRKLLPDYLTFGLIETNGMVFCSADPTNRSVNLGDRPYFQRVVQTRKFATGDFQVGRLTGQPALNFGYPVLDEQGQLRRVLFASLKLSLLSEAAAKIRLPSGGTVMVVDRNGNVLARHPEPEKWVGKALTAAPVVQRILTQKEGVFEMKGLDGIPCLYAATAITDGETPSMFVSVGIPVTVSFARANEALVRNFLVLGLVAVVVFAAVRFYAQRFFLRPINTLAGTAKELAEGNLSARTGTIQGSAELLQLGHAFDDMAERLQKRQAEVEQAHQQITALNQDLERRVEERTAQLAAANQDLEHERYLLHTLMDNIPAAIYFKDLKSRFQRNNRAHARRLGLADPSQAVGKTDLDFFSAAHAKQAYEDEQQIIRTGELINKEEMETWPDGRVTWALTVKLPLRDEHGQIVGTFGISHDITERKRAEEERDRFFTLSLDMLGIANTDGYFKRINPAFAITLGWSTEEILARPFLDLVHPEDRAATVREVEKLAAGQPTLHFENRYQCKDGSWKTVAWRAAPHPDGTIYCTGRDETEQKAAKAAIQKLNLDLQQRAAQLEEANNELASFSYSVSHDLRSPLRGIDGFSQALEEDYGDKLGEMGKGYLTRVRAAAHRMGELIDDLLKLSRITRADLHRQSVDLSALARSVAGELQRRDPERQVQWEIADGLLAEGDPQLLRVALENLLGNAWKFTGKRPAARIEFGRSQRDGQSVFFVRDNGAGFDMAYAAKLFGAFQRLHSLAEFEGTGVGLATVQRIVHRHGGRVWAEGEVDKGATFYFLLSGASRAEKL